MKSVDEPFGDLPCSAQITLPPLSAVYFEFKRAPEKKTKKAASKKNATSQKTRGTASKK